MKKIFLWLISVLILYVSAEAKWGDEKQFIPIPEGTSLVGDVVYFSINGMNFDKYRSIFIGYEVLNWKRAVIDLNTHGGSLFDAMGMVSLIQDQQRKGKIIEIRGRGLIASAGLLILISGTPGYRFLDAHSMLMFHELFSFKFFAIETPSDKESEAEIFRKIQNKINSYIVKHSKMSEEELNSRIKKREYWFDASEAVKYGFADEIF
jgi:ATP-dependent protease ClpP protease subunit